MNKKLAEDMAKYADSKNFKKEEIDVIVNYSKRMCSMPIRNYLLWLVETEIKDKDQSNELTSLVNAMSIADTTGCQTIEIPMQHNKYVIGFQVAIIEKSHPIDIMIPNLGEEKEKALGKQIFQTMDRLAEMVNVYYKQMMIDYPRLFMGLSNAMKTIDLSALKVNQNNRSLAFTEEHEKRLGVVLFYVDKDGKPIFE